MKKNTLLFTICFLAFHYIGIAQDKIITNQNDTVDCRIIKVDDKEILFEINTKGVRSTETIKQSDVLLLQMSQVSMQAISKKNNTLKKAVSSVPKETKIKTKKITTSEIERTHPFTFRVQSGYGYLTASSAYATSNLESYGFDHTSARNYYQKFRNTLILGATLQYDILTYKLYTLSLGLTYQNQYNTSSITGNIDIGDGIHQLYGTYAENVYCNFYGTNFRFQYYSNNTKKTNIYLEYGVGLLTYRNEFELGYSPLLFKAQTMGTYFNIGIETRLFKSFYLDINSGLFVALIKNISVTNGITTQNTSLTNDQYESLLKGTISAGLSYKF